LVRRSPVVFFAFELRIVDIVGEVIKILVDSIGPVRNSFPPSVFKSRSCISCSEWTLRLFEKAFVLVHLQKAHLDKFIFDKIDKCLGDIRNLGSISEA